MVDPRPDDAERHGEDNDVEHQVRRHAALAHPQFGHDRGRDDAEHDTERIRPDRNYADMPDPLRRAGDLRERHGGERPSQCWGKGGDRVHECTRYRRTAEVGGLARTAVRF